MAIRTRDYRDYKREYSTSGMIREIERLREQADELSAALQERVVQSQKLQRTLGDREKEYNDCTRTIERTLEDLRGQIESLDLRTSEQLHCVKEDFYKSLVDQNKILESTCVEIDKRLKELQRELAILNDNDNSIKVDVNNALDELESKVDKKTIRELTKKNSLLMGITIANTTGIVVVLGLLCYLLISMGH